MMVGGTGLSGPRRRIGWIAALLLVWLTGVLAAGAAHAATVRRIEIGDRQIVIGFDRPIDGARVSVLAPTVQIAIDLDDARPGRDVEAGGLVKRVTQAPLGKDMRITLDLATPAIVSDGSFGSDGRELTLILQPVDPRRFAAAGTAEALRFSPMRIGNFGLRRPYRVSVPIPPPAKAPPLPPVEGNRQRPLVVIDAGHGGPDPGAINAALGLREKDLTLQIAKRIRDELVADGRVRVALTRSTDRFLVLRERFGIARRLHADLFISIHCDSTGSGNGTGASVYTLSDVASDKEAARLAARENKADIIAGINLGDEGSDVSSILIDLTQRETMNASAMFARLFGREAQGLVPMKANFHRQASLMVLKAPDMPSVLIETGYISNPVDAAFLASRSGQGQIAEAVAHAVQIHFARRLAGG